VVGHACNLSTGEAESGGLQVPGHPRLHRKFHASLCYIVSKTLTQKNQGVPGADNSCLYS
jgi:hypothetical protein